MTGSPSVVITAEHAGRTVPAAYRHLFESPAARAALDSHRGWDPGSLEIAEAMADRMGAPLVVQRVTRLLVECNRSIGHHQLWSDFSRDLSGDEKERVLRDVWYPHRDAVRTAITSRQPGLVVHVGVHSFTPVWRGRRRSTDIGILFDPSRAAEAHLALAWQRALQRDPATSGLTVHRNRPYRGWTDGLVTALRAELPESRYVGFEVELSQGLMPVSARIVEALVAGVTARSASHLE